MQAQLCWHARWVMEDVEEEGELCEERKLLEDGDDALEEDPVQVSPRSAQAFWPGPKTRTHMEFWHSV